MLIGYANVNVEILLLFRDIILEVDILKAVVVIKEKGF